MDGVKQAATFFEQLPPSSPFHGLLSAPTHYQSAVRVEEAMPYAIYLRKSRADLEAEARGEGETLARHRAVLMELAKRQRLDIGQVYEEIVSGETLSARPMAQRLLQDVQSGKWEGVLVMEVERLARGDTIDQGQVAQAFKWSGTKIVTPIKTYDPNNEFDEEYFEFSLFMSRREYKAIRRRMEAGRIAAVKEGQYMGSVAPYGYRRVKTAQGYTLEAEPQEAQVVRDIFHWYVYGVPQADGTVRRLGVSLIARRLNGQGVPTRKGGAWAAATIGDILRNPVYVGQIRWNSRKTRPTAGGARTRPRTPQEQQILVDGRHPPLVSKDLFQQAQHNLSQRRPAPVPDRGLTQNPLSGLMVCGQCGRNMVRRPYASGQEPSLLCTCTACSNVSAALRLVEERLLDAMTAWLGAYQVQLQGQPASYAGRGFAARKAVDARIAACASQQAALCDLLERGVYSSEEFLSRSQILKERLRSLEAARAELETALGRAAAQSSILADFLPRWQAVLAAYKAASTAQEKNELLKAVLRKVVYTRESGGRWHARHDNFSLELFPLLPGEEKGFQA